MQVTVNRLKFVEEFLTPIQLVSDAAIISIKKGFVDCLAYSMEPQTILYCKNTIATGFEDDTQINLNFPSIRKFSSALRRISDDYVTLKIGSNNISMGNADGTIHFKYHLLDDGIIQIPPIKIEKLHEMEFDFETDMSQEAIESLVQNSFFSENSRIVNLYTKDGKVYCEIGDSDGLSDSVDMLFSETFTGNHIKPKMSFDFETFRKFFNLKRDNMHLKINTQRGLLLFELSKGDFKMEIITTAQSK